MDTTTLANLSQPREALPATSCLHAKFGKMKLLVIDDAPANVALLEGVLGDNGYARVKSITDSRLAVETYRSFEPDLILLDLMMPFVDGFAVLEAIRSEPAEMFLPVIVLTADASEPTKIRALRAGASDFLLKPFEQVEALLRIENLLTTRQLYIQLDTQRAAFEDALRAKAQELRDAQLALAKLTRAPR
jgi:putative two-component system response regulator